MLSKNFPSIVEDVAVNFVVLYGVNVSNETVVLRRNVIISTELKL